MAYDVFSRFDVDDWFAKLNIDPQSLEGVRSGNGRIYESGFVCCPKGACNNARFRNLVMREFRPSVPVPTDVMIAVLGEPADRAMTKIGGTPYLPKHISWPKGHTGNPLPFLAQFNFAFSMDIVGDLGIPGQVLLLFCDLNADVDDPFEALQYIWSPYPLNTRDLITSKELPVTSDFDPIHYIPWRTCNYRSTEKFEKLPDEFVIDGLRLNSAYLFNIYGTQIGQSPFRFGVSESSGATLCCLCPPGGDWHEELIENNVDTKDMARLVGKQKASHRYIETFGVRDGEALYFYLSESGKLEWISIGG